MNCPEGAINTTRWPTMGIVDSPSLAGVTTAEGRQYGIVSGFQNHVVNGELTKKRRFWAVGPGFSVRLPLYGFAITGFITGFAYGTYRWMSATSSCYDRYHYELEKVDKTRRQYDNEMSDNRRAGIAEGVQRVAGTVPEHHAVGYRDLIEYLYAQKTETERRQHAEKIRESLTKRFGDIIKT